VDGSWEWDEMQLKIVLTIVTIGAASALAGCAMDSHADSTGNFGPGGTTSEGKAPDCYDGTGSGQGQFGGWKNKYAAEQDAGGSGASAPFNALLGQAVQSAPRADPDLLLGWGGGGDGGYDKKKKPC
jgi:hypothetical protein